MSGFIAENGQHMASKSGQKPIVLDAPSEITKTEEDEQRAHRAGVKRAPPVEADSPSKQRAGSVSVDIETLRSLLAEQSAVLLDKVMEGQRQQMQQLAGDLRAEIHQSESAVKEELQAHAQDIGGIKKEQTELAMRLQKLETQGVPGSTASVSTAMEASNPDRHKFTLIFGGWQRDTPRKLITDQAHKALQEVGVARFTDFPCFCTGPRRSLTLLQFKVRSPHEDFAGMRERMGKVMTAVNQSTVILRGGKKMWCGFSKPRHERDRGAHGALLRRTVRLLSPAQEEDLEVEYATGSGWIREYKLSSAIMEPEEPGDHEFMRFDPVMPGASLPWFDITALSECLQAEPAAVRKAIEDSTRR